MDSYELIDFGDLRKFECIGGWVIDCLVLVVRNVYWVVFDFWESCDGRYFWNLKNCDFWCWIGVLLGEDWKVLFNCLWFDVIR